MISEKTKTPSPRKKKHCLLVPKKNLAFPNDRRKESSCESLYLQLPIVVKDISKKVQGQQEVTKSPTFWTNFLEGFFNGWNASFHRFHGGTGKKKRNGSFRKDRLGPLGEVGRAELEELKVVRFVVFLERTHKRKTYPRWKFNMAPENKPSQKESHLQTIIF